MQVRILHEECVKLACKLQVRVSSLCEYPASVPFCIPPLTSQKLFFAKGLDKFTWQEYNKDAPSTLGIKNPRSYAMNKEEILELSRKENEGKQDEREILAYGEAGRNGMAVGGIICAILVFLSEFLFNIPEIGLASWLVYFAMYGANRLTLYVKLKERKHLFSGIITLVTSALFAVALCVI